MEPLETLLSPVAENIETIKWLLASLLLLGLCGCAYLTYLFFRLKKMLEPEPASDDFRQSARWLLNTNALDHVVALASQRVENFPGDLFAHWYLGQAYYRQKQWHKALAEFNYIYDVAPSWRQRFVNPFIIDIREQLQSKRPEIIKR
jgi:tetratricopeptide (TPR) repeat protein